MFALLTRHLDENTLTRQVRMALKQSIKSIAKIATREPHHTQWAAQFFVAGELCKRGYDVSFTMGNRTPIADLMVVSPIKKATFLVDVG
jgi:hypothetical protein